jgi:hypothetical protein
VIKSVENFVTVHPGSKLSRSQIWSLGTRNNQAVLPKTTQTGEYNSETAKAVLPLLAQILGLET